MTATRGHSTNHSLSGFGHFDKKIVSEPRGIFFSVSHRFLREIPLHNMVLQRVDRLKKLRQEGYTVIINRLLVPLSYFCTQNKFFTSRPRISSLSRKLPVSKGLFLLVFFSSCLPNTGEKRSLLAGNQKQERLSKKLAVTCTEQNLWTPAVTRTDHSRPQNKDGLWGRECALIERYGNK